jgi:hypothetical protein
MKVTRLAMLVAAVALLAIPGAASAHPSVYVDEALSVPSPAPAPPIDPGELASTIRYVVSNHGNSYVLRESNSETGNGVVDYKRAPGGWRSQSSVTTADLLQQAATGAQAHHSCRTPALDAISAIEGWQDVSGAGKPEPFYAYVPFQKASAGLDDHPEVWIPHVLTLTGADLSTVSDDAAAAATQLQTMCEALPGGVFVPADAMQTAATAFNSSTILAATDPLNARIADLETLAGELGAQKAAAEKAAADARAAMPAAPGAGTAAQAAAAAQAEVARLSTRLRLKPVGAESVEVTGPAGKRVVVRLRLTRAGAKAAGWKSLVLAKETVTLGQDGTALVGFALGRQADAALRKADADGVYFAARSGDRWTSTRKR